MSVSGAVPLYRFGFWGRKELRTKRADGAAVDLSTAGQLIGGRASAKRCRGAGREDGREARGEGCDGVQRRVGVICRAGADRCRAVWRCGYDGKQYVGEAGDIRIAGEHACMYRRNKRVTMPR